MDLSCRAGNTPRKITSSSQPAPGPQIPPKEHPLQNHPLPLLSELMLYRSPKKYLLSNSLFPYFWGALGCGTAPGASLPLPGGFWRPGKPRSLSQMLEVSDVPSRVQTRCSESPAMARVWQHTQSTEGEDNDSMQLVMAMQDDGKHPPGPGQPAGTPRLTQHPCACIPASSSASVSVATRFSHPWIPPVPL